MVFIRYYKRARYVRGVGVFVFFRGDEIKIQVFGCDGIL